MSLLSLENNHEVHRAKMEPEELELGWGECQLDVLKVLDPTPLLFG